MVQVYSVAGNLQEHLQQNQESLLGLLDPGNQEVYVTCISYSEFHCHNKALLALFSAIIGRFQNRKIMWLKKINLNLFLNEISFYVI